MKNYFLFFITCILALAYACSETDFDSNNDIETRSSVAYGPSDASTLNTPSCFPELCPRPPDIPVPGPWPTDVLFGLNTNPTTQIVFRTGTLDYTLQATGSSSDSREYTLVTDEGVYVLTDSQSEELSEIQESSYKVPQCIYKVFDMDYSKMVNGEASVEDFATVFEGREIANEGENGRIVVNIPTLEIDECEPPQYVIRTLDWCEQRPAATTSRWMTNMTSNIGMDVFTTAVVRSVIHEAVKDCAGDTDCDECINPRCILDKINLADIGSSIKDQINTNYVNLIDDKVNDAYDVDSGTLSTTALDVREFLISEDCKPTVIGVCGVEILGEDFVDLIENGSPEDVDELLARLSQKKSWLREIGFPKSNIEQDNSECAKKLDCIYKKWKKTMLCNNTFKIFEELNPGNDVTFGLDIEFDGNFNAEAKHSVVTLGYEYRVGISNVTGVKVIDENDPDCCFPGFNGQDWRNLDDTNKYTQTDGWSRDDDDQADTFYVTGKDENGNRINTATRVALNGHLCEYKNALEIGSMLTHELLHTKMLGLFESITGKPAFEAGGNVWDALLEHFNVGGQDIQTQHQLFNEVFKDDLIDALMEFNGDTDQDNREKYLYLVLDNLAPDVDPDNPPNANDPFNLNTPLATRKWDLANTFVRVNPTGTTLADYNANVAEVDRLKKLSQSLSYLTDQQGNYVDTNGNLLPVDTNGNPIPPAMRIPRPSNLAAECTGE